MFAVLSAVVKLCLRSATEMVSEQGAAVPIHPPFFCKGQIIETPKGAA
jgi:hypothetical protein